MKLAIIITSDPKNGEEALGRAFNALALAAEAQEKNDEVSVVFAGTGVRWPAEFSKPTHPAHGLYNAVRPAIAGASCGCSAVFGATKEVEACGLPEIKDFALAGTPGFASIRRYLAEAGKLSCSKIAVQQNPSLSATPRSHLDHGRPIHAYRAHACRVRGGASLLWADVSRL